MKKQKFKWNLNSATDRVELVEQVAANLGYEALVRGDTGVMYNTTTDLSIASRCEWAPVRIEFNFKNGARCYVAGYATADNRLRTGKHLDYHIGRKCRKQTARAAEWGCVIRRNSDPAVISAALLEKITVAERILGASLRNGRIEDVRRAKEMREASDLMCAMLGFEDNPNSRAQFHSMPKHVPGYRIAADIHHDGGTPLVTMQVTMSASDAGEAVGYLTAIPSVALP